MSEYLLAHDVWVSQHKLPMRVKGFCKRLGDDDCIVVNEDLPEDQKYETVAHEILHFKRGDLWSDESVMAIEDR